MPPKRTSVKKKSAPRGVTTRLHVLEGHYQVLNREMGEVVGELRTIKWLGAGTFLAAAGALVKSLFGG